MYLTYGNTTLQVIDLVRYERENVYDPSGTDILYVKVTLGVSAVYSPGGLPNLPSVTALTEDTASVLEGTDDTAGVLDTTPRGLNPSGSNFLTGGPPALESGVTPVTSQYTGAETDAELRYRLLYPRQPLILWAADRQTGNWVRWLQSPRPGFELDCANGPKPLSCDVVTTQGEVTVGVLYQIETAVQPCPAGSDRLILSHRWTMSHTHDERNYLTRVIRGTVVFNSAVVQYLAIYPDWIRNQFLHPVPLGYERKVPEITQSADGLVITYTITDTDPTIVFEPADSGATSIEIRENCVLAVPEARVALNRYQVLAAAGKTANPFIRLLRRAF